jgi:hypothetical protein
MFGFYESCIEKERNARCIEQRDIVIVALTFLFTGRDSSIPPRLFICTDGRAEVALWLAKSCDVPLITMAALVGGAHGLKTGDKLVVMAEELSIPPQILSKLVFITLDINTSMACVFSSAGLPLIRSTYLRTFAALCIEVTVLVPWARGGTEVELLDEGLPFTVESSFLGDWDSAVVLASMPPSAVHSPSAFTQSMP